MHVVTAAGNTDEDAKYYSPARMTAIITVGASTFTDSRAWFSNKGELVDVYAPGVFIFSATSKLIESEGVMVCEFFFSFFILLSSANDHRRTLAHLP